MFAFLRRAGRAIASGFRTGEPTWVIAGAGLLCIVAIPLLNAPTGIPTTMTGKVVSCRSGTSRLQGYVRTMCTAELPNGARPSFESMGPVPHGAEVAFVAVQHRLYGFYYEVSHFLPPAHVVPRDGSGSPVVGRPPPSLPHRELLPPPFPPLHPPTP